MSLKLFINYLPAKYFIVKITINCNLKNHIILNMYFQKDRKKGVCKRFIKGVKKGVKGCI